MDDMCCETCAFMKKLVKLDYTQGGCRHTVMTGWVCTALADEGNVYWMVGLDEEMSECECWCKKIEEK